MKLVVELEITTSFGNWFQALVTLMKKLLRTIFWAWGLNNLEIVSCGYAR